MKRNVQSKIKDIVDASFKKMVSWREHLHAHPELSFLEVNTSAFVASNLEEMGIPYQHGIAGTGVVALIKGQNPEKQCIAFVLIWMLYQYMKKMRLLINQKNKVLCMLVVMMYIPRVC